MILEPRHPAANIYAGMGDSAADTGADPTAYRVFYSHRSRCDIVIWTGADGKAEWGKIPALNHIRHDMSTMGCSVAWSIDSEIKAMETLQSLVEPHIYKMYFLSGMFLETSRRSGVTYIFRKLRPTIALRPNAKGEMRILCALCLHPIGYYRDSYAGAMCPTDDVISHLMLMRGDEHLFWRRANQHAPHRPEAGI